MTRNPIIAAADAVGEAVSFIRAIEMTTRARQDVFADSEDADAIAAVSIAARDRLEDALRLLREGVKV